jgi:hypothetical protein
VLDFGYFVFYPYPGTQLFQICRDEGYLADDYLDREANHRESILSLPTLTKADIAEYYDAFTELRRRIYAAQVGEDASPELLNGVTDHVFERARTG